ncbi:ras-like small GTPase, putative [Leishmania guyanensis]|uniref:Ras-like small GTPases, putative n=1 Tax=Leishmania guyanensis TaxID=5670 RepID=A0A1E1J2N7_LEIGU|nr:ras-like small GTPases, putative [Leishmania guyanensis]
MRFRGQDVSCNDVDDFTYSEDPAGQQVKVPVTKEYVYKVVVLGDYSVGKTSIIKRLVSIAASSQSLGVNSGGSDMDDSGNDSDADDELAAVTPTVGTDFYSLVLPHVVPGASVRLQIWDTAGLEKYAANYQSTLRNTSFIICVFDVTSASSLHNVVERHLSIAAEHVPDLDQSSIMVVANKIDILDDASNSTALRSAQRRSRSPETAFVITHDEDTSVDTNDGSPGKFTSAKGIDKDAIVTARKVQAEVFDIFSDVLYAEVSAKTKRHLEKMLHAVCHALLRNGVRGSSEMLIPDGTPANEVFAHTVLPPHTGVSSTTVVSVPTFSPPSASQLDPATTKTPPVVELRGAPHTDSGQKAPRTLAAPAASWRSTGTFSFDMAQTHIVSTALFSPTEALDSAFGNRGGDDSAPSRVDAGGDSPIDESLTQLPTPQGSTVKPVDAGGVHLGMIAGAPEPRSALDPNEDRKARREREQAEMQALLVRAGKGVANRNGGDADTGGSAVWRRSDADRMEEDIVSGPDKAGEALSAAQQRPTSSILDSRVVQNDSRGRPGASGRSSDDEDGARMQTQLRDRFAQIEREIRQNAAVANLHGKKDKKTKARGKCKCCVL